MTVPPNGAIRILLFSRQSLIRAALCSMINGWPGMTISGSVDTHEAIIATCNRSRPNIIVYVDEREGEQNYQECPLELLSPIFSEDHEVRFLLLTGLQNIDIHVCAVRHGAAGIILKNSLPEDLKRAIEGVSRGELWLPRQVTAQLVRGAMRNKGNNAAQDPIQAKLNSLSSRETEVLKLLGAGKKNKEIGEELFISEVTVRHHVTSIFNKLGLSSRLELIVFLYQNQVIDIAHPSEQKLLSRMMNPFKLRNSLAPSNRPSVRLSSESRGPGH